MNAASNTSRSLKTLGVVAVLLLLLGAGVPAVGATPSEPRAAERAVLADAAASANAVSSVDAFVPWGTPVGYWTFDKYLADSSQDGVHDAACTTCGTYDTSRLAPTAHTNTTSYHFVSANKQWMEVFDNPHIVMTTTMTAAAWVYLSNSANDQKIIGKTDDTHTRGWVLGVYSGKVRCETWNASGTRVRIDAGTVSSNQWVHVACSYRNGGSQVVYVNGANVGSQTVSGDIGGTTTHTLVMGKPPWNEDAAYVDGWLDDVRLYDRELTAEEVKGLGTKKSDAKCFAKPTRSGFSDGTIYATANGAAVQAGVDLVEGGTGASGWVDLSGTCTGTVSRSGENQIARVTGYVLRLSGGWSADFSSQNSAATVLDANKEGRALCATGDLPTTNLTLDKLNMKNGQSSSSYGGAVYTGRPLTVANSNITDSTATGQGGGVYATEGLTMSDSTVARNQSDGDSGGLRVSSSAHDSVTLTRVTVDGNTAKGYTGGGMGLVTDAVIDSCTFSNNQAGTVSSGQGGGLYAAASGHTIKIKNSTFSANRTGIGAGILTRYGTVILQGVTVTENHGTNGTGVHGRDSGLTNVTGSIIAGNYKQVSGGETLGNDLGTESSATFGSGGRNLVGTGSTGAFTADFDQIGLGDPLLGPLASNGGPTKTHLPDANSPAIDAGECKYDAVTWTVDQRGSGYPRQGTGSDFCDAGAVERQSVAASCYASRSTNADFKSVNGRALQHAIDNLSYPGTVRVGGTCKGAWYRDGQVQLVKFGQGLTLIGGSDETYLNPTPSGQAVLDALQLGRVMRVISNGGESSAKNLELRNGLPSGSGNGGGLYNSGILTLTNAWFHGNQANHGGGIFVDGVLTLTDSKVESNTAQDTGGGICLNSAAGSVTLARVTITTNTANNSGGGVSNWVSPTLTDVTISGNTAANNGGGFYNAGANSQFDKVTFSANKATNGRGGALANDGGATLTRVTVSGNQAKTEGGGISNAGTVSVRHSTITDNIAPKGAGIASNSTGATKVGNSIVSGNDPSGGTGDDVEWTGGNDVFQSFGYNLIGSTNSTTGFRADFDQVWVVDPKLAALASNGGYAQTRALNADSPAIDAGGCTVDGSNPTQDQAGLTRPSAANTPCDIGAYELATPKANCIAEATKQGSTVTKKSQNGRALQEAVDWLAGPGSVKVSSGSSVLACQGAWRKNNSYQLVYTSQPVTLTLTGQIALDAQGKGRVLTVGGGTVTVQGPSATSLTNGVAASGGGVSVVAGATAVITGTTIKANSAAISGNALAVSGRLTVTNTTVSLNNSSPVALGWNAANQAERYKDSGSFGNHGVCSGSACPAVTTIDGRTALKFNGTSSGQVVRAANADSLNSKTALTLAAWVRPTTTSGDQKLFGKFAYGSFGRKGYLLGLTDGKVNFEVGDTSFSQRQLLSGPVLAEWTHIAATYRTGGEMRVYINGQLKGAMSPGDLELATITNDFIVGAAPWDTNAGKFNGGLYQIRVYNKELTQSEISALYSSSKEPADGGAHGGALYVASGATANVESSTFDTNRAGRGGGIYQAGGTLFARNVTLSGNTALWSGGGIWHAGGDATIRFATITKNAASEDSGPGAGNIHNVAAGIGNEMSLFAAIVTAPGPDGKMRTNCGGATAFTSEGYNRFSDTSCSTSPENHPDDRNGQDVPLDALKDNGGPTKTHKLKLETNNSPAVDIMAAGPCYSAFDEGLAVDQRGRDRPRVGIRGAGQPDDPNLWKCDAGAFELGIELLRVCGPPLPVTDLNLCDFTSITAALKEAQPEDTIVVNGVVTEKGVTVDKNVTIRGPTDEQTPAWHMGILQADSSAPSGTHTRGRMLIIPAGQKVNISDLNLRWGDADQGGAIKNDGTLILERVTLYQNKAGEGAAVYSTGPLTVTNSTLSGNTAGSDSGALHVATGGSLVARYNTFKDNGPFNIKSAGTATAVGNVFAGSDSQTMCSGNISGDYNLTFPATATACTAGANDLGGDPRLGTLRDNGGLTLTHMPGPASAVIEAGQLVDECGLDMDQRGIARPFDSPGGGGAACDLGAVEAGLRTLRVCANCETDLAALRFNSLQAALDQAGANETVQVEAGEHTGNFVIYRDVTIEHAGLDLSKLRRDVPVDVRAILQASDRSVADQRQLKIEGGTVLTIQSYTPTATSIEPSGEVTVTLRDLTIRNGLALNGGGIYNRGFLTIERSTIAGNAARNVWDKTEWNTTSGPPKLVTPAAGGGIYNLGTLDVGWSTLSGNQSELQGGAVASSGITESGGQTRTARASITNSTLAENKAARLANNHLVGVNDTTFAPVALDILPGDAVRFENRTSGQTVTLYINPDPGVTCEGKKTLTLPVVGAGPSDPLICQGPDKSKVTVTDGSVSSSRALVIAISLPDMNGMKLAGNSVFAGPATNVQFARSIVSDGDSASDNCALAQGATDAKLSSGEYNLIDDTSCVLSTNDEFPGAALYAPFELGPLQDNNWIGFDGACPGQCTSGGNCPDKCVSGYTYTHALRPGSPAIDRIPLNVCTAGVTPTTVNLASPNLATTIDPGDVVTWSSATARTVALNDGEANVVLIDVPAGGASRPYQFNNANEVIKYGVYDASGHEYRNADGVEITGVVTITQQAVARVTDQRGLPIPQRGGPADSATYLCDIGAVEYRPWYVGEALLRPPSAVGTTGPSLTIAAAGKTDYLVWSGADALSIPVQPTPLKNDGKLELDEWATVAWDTDPNPSSIKPMPQYGTIEWPDEAQVHISDAPVDLAHQWVAGSYTPLAARAFVDRSPNDTLTGLMISNVFSRTLATNGTTYSVIQFGRGTSNGQVLVRTVRTYPWTTPGIRDFRDRNPDDGDLTNDCIIGDELRYPAFGGLAGHSDPESKSGKILYGTAFDGVQVAGDLQFVQNTVDNLLPPAHVRETRAGPILPVLEAAPTSGPDDLDVAWYRPDSLNLAWPVKAVGYRCQWPAKPPKIVIASELGSEIAEQQVLATAGYLKPTVYHQAEKTWPGYSPNWEHALLAASNLGNTAPALYGLRTDLKDRDTGGGGKSFALLKFQDPAQQNRIQLRAYSVVLTQPVQPITNTVKGGGTIYPVSGSQAAVAAAQAAWASEAAADLVGSGGAGASPQQSAAVAATMRLQIGSGVMASNGTTTVSVDALGAASLASSVVEVTYDNSQVKPVLCRPNSNLLSERPYSAVLETDDNVRAGFVAHMRVTAAAGTGLRYEWDFGDGTRPQYDGRTVSHVYAKSGNPEASRTYHVSVKVSNAYFDEVLTPDRDITILPSDASEIPSLLPPDDLGNGCNINTLAGTSTSKIVLDLGTLSRHGRSGDFKLADLTFAPVNASSVTTTTLSWGDTTLKGPDYTALEFPLTAGNPMYAPTPLRGLLDIQPCELTQASLDAKTGYMPQPFWKDWKGMLWTRAAGNMDVLYYYPLQPGFPFPSDAFTDEQLKELGLKGDATDVGKCVPWLHNLAAGTVSVPDTSFKVYPVAYRAQWPDQPGLLNVGETVYERAKGGVSGVASQVAVSRIYDDLAQGHWGMDTEKIELDGQEVPVYLTSLIDPVGEVKVELPLEGPDGVPALPALIQTKRLLFGGGLSILGKAGDPNKTLPFSLRSRIIYQDTPEDVDGDDTANGVLIFRGYYDGTSPEYIKGDPLLLLNVMAASDKARLEELCDDGSEDCKAFIAAVEELYWKTQNPRQLDLCRNAAGELYAGDPDEAPQGAKDDDLSKLCPSGYYRDGQPDHALLNSLQDTPIWDKWDYSVEGKPERKENVDGVLDTGDGIPEPYEGLGKGKALTAGNAAGTGYVTLAYNNDSSLGGLPVSLQVVKVQCARNENNEESPYRGNLLVIKSDNLFDEKLTLRHTGDFGGKPDNFEFEWWIAAVDDTGVSPTLLPSSYPWQKWTRAEPGMNGVLGPEITIEGANPTTLRDNWVIVRYRNTRCPVCGNQVRFSAYAGDPSAKPSQVLGQLAEGWIKRVVNALNPFDTRVTDFVSSPVNTTVDMIRQAGHRYEGPVALNADPDNLNSMGLIEAYQTVLERGKALSINSGINDQGANAALLNVASRIAQLYMMLGNDAYVDALDPIVGFDGDNTTGIRAPAVYAFANQFRPDQFGLIDEELGLLRGRDETLGGVAAAPTYNRLTWNFTNGEGEVAYVLNYNIDDVNLDGFINEADAAIMYPQGHGDAYGHQLTALTTYYDLLRHPNYTWIPRAEPVSVAGAPVVVDYYDERRFAAAAAARAKMGAEIVNLTYRKNYAEPNVQEYRDTQVDTSDKCLQSDEGEARAPGCNERGWGVADWAGRTAEGAYFDWLMANALVPPVDNRYSDVRKIDRTTVEDISSISVELSSIQSQLDRADQGVNPLGLAQQAVLFDLDPALTKTTPGNGEGQEGETHFEQIYDKTLRTVANSLKMFAFANQAKAAQRAGQDEQQTFAKEVLSEDRAIINELIEIFGYPYDKDIGVNGTYPEGYEGPDIYNYNLIERTDLTDYKARCNEDQPATCQAETKTELVWFGPMECLGHYVVPLTISGLVDAASICDLKVPPEPTKLEIEYRVGVGLDTGRGRYLPQSWEGASRKAWGEVQNKMWTVYDTRVAFEQAIVAYENKLAEIEEAKKALEDKVHTLEATGAVRQTRTVVLDALDVTMAVLTGIGGKAKYAAELVGEVGEVAAKCVPDTYGLANSAGAPPSCAVEGGAKAGAEALKALGAAMEAAVKETEIAKSVVERHAELELFQLESDYELRQMGRELQGKLRELEPVRLSLFLAADTYGGAQLDYDATVEKGFRKLAGLIALRKRWAGQVMSARYNDMAYRIAENDALQKYRQQFDLAQLYTYLTAAAYDYETNLKGEDPAAGEKLLRRITAERSLGDLRWGTGAWDIDPIVGSGGLADVLGKLRDNFHVLKGQLGFNNPQSQTTRFSLRRELFRLRNTSDAAWRDTLERYYTPNIYSDPDVQKLAKKPYGTAPGAPQPGLVIPFRSTIQQGLNFFGQPAGPGDHTYNPTQFATKIASVGVWFKGYDEERLVSTPYVYLLPAGEDVLRPRNSTGVLRYWPVVEQLLPLPYPITDSDMTNSRWIPGMDGLQGQLFQTKPYAAFQAFPYTDELAADEMNTDTRLIGRSVWNTRWVLVIPGANLLADGQMGIDRFVEDVDDIYVYFQTYGYSGASTASMDVAATPLLEPAALASAAAQTVEPSAEAAGTDSVAKPMPQPDVMFYGTVQRDGKPLDEGTLVAILLRMGTVTTQIAPIAGTNYNYALSVPMAYYDAGDTNYASDSVRLGETVRFTVNGVPALLKTPAGVTYNEYRVDFAGAGYTVTVDTSGPGAYPLGDVNVSGKRDSADALLVLKYDVGLASGVTTWPPGPATVYVPLCDITQDGACNSTDALRILMCDVGLATCPGDATTASAAEDDLAAAEAVQLTLTQAVDPTSQEFVVAVSVLSPGRPLAAVALDLRYDPAQLAVGGCAENPDGWLELAACNPSYGPGTVRYSGISTGGVAGPAKLLELRFIVKDPALLAGNATPVALVQATAFDAEGNALRPVWGPQPPKVDPAALPNKVFVPVIGH